MCELASEAGPANAEVKMWLTWNTGLVIEKAKLRDWDD